MSDRPELRIVAHTVHVDLGRIIDNDLEWFLDYLSEEATGTVILQDIAYDVKGATDTGTLVLHVSGWIDLADMDTEEINELTAYIAERRASASGRG